MATATELAWAAGFFDGEGFTSVAFPREGRWPRLRVGITQYNRETLERFAHAVGAGTIYGPRAGTTPGAERWDYQITRVSDIRRVMLDLAPYLSGPKREQAAAAFAAWEAARVGIPTEITCAHCGETVVRELERGLQPALRYCSRVCQRRAAARRQTERRRATR